MELMKRTIAEKLLKKAPNLKMKLLKKMKLSELLMVTVWMLMMGLQTARALLIAKRTTWIVKIKYKTMIQQHQMVVHLQMSMLLKRSEILMSQSMTKML